MLPMRVSEIPLHWRASGLLAPMLKREEQQGGERLERRRERKRDKGKSEKNT